MFSRVKQILFLLYIWIVFYYTFYGFAKSYLEYFCKQRRSGPEITRQTFSTKEIYKYENFLDFETHIFVKNGKIHSTFPETKTESTFTFFKYKNNDNIFEISCRPVNTKSKVRLMQTYFIDPLGFVRPWDGVEILSNDHMFCTNWVSKEICEMKKETKDTFFKVFFYFLTPIYLLTLFLSDLNIMNYSLRKVIRYNLNLLGLNDIAGIYFGFCNPITGEQTSIGKGGLVKVMGFGPFNLPLNKKVKSYFFKDKVGFYYVCEGQVCCNLSNKTITYKMDEVKLGNLIDYFIEINNDSKRCVVNGNLDHHLTTLEVIKLISLGMSIMEVEIQKDINVSRIIDLDIELIKDATGLASESICELIHHNMCFFNFSNPNLKYLIQALKGKIIYVNNGVKNSKWKRYFNDVLIICKKHNYTIKKHEVIFPPSRCLNGILINPPEKYNIESIGSLSGKKVALRETDLNIKNLNEVYPIMEQSLMNCVKGTDPADGFDFDPNFVENKPEIRNSTFSGNVDFSNYFEMSKINAVSSLIDSYCSLYDSEVKYMRERVPQVKSYIEALNENIKKEGPTRKPSQEDLDRMAKLKESMLYLRKKGVAKMSETAINTVKRFEAEIKQLSGTENQTSSGIKFLGILKKKKDCVTKSLIEMENRFLKLTNRFSVLSDVIQMSVVESHAELTKNITPKIKENLKKKVFCKRKNANLNKKRKKKKKQGDSEKFNVELEEVSVCKDIREMAKFGFGPIYDKVRYGESNSLKINDFRNKLYWRFLECKGFLTKKVIDKKETLIHNAQLKINQYSKIAENDFKAIFDEDWKNLKVSLIDSLEFVKT